VKKQQHILLSLLCWPAGRLCTSTAHGASETRLLMVCETLGEALAQTQQLRVSTTSSEAQHLNAKCGRQ